ncbi:MAG: hypothetical protein ROR55_14710 [Devosia sp.]
MSALIGTASRLARLMSGPEGRAACLAFDHGLHIGPIPGAENTGAVMDAAVAAKLDGVIVSPGLAIRHAGHFCGADKPSLILRLDQTAMWRVGTPGGYEMGETRPVATVEEAIQLGADAVITYLFFSHQEPGLESASVRFAAETARACRHHGMPYIIEPMAARGGLIDDPFDADVIAHNCRMAVEVGADVIKTDWSGSTASFRKVVDAVDAPILVAGGAHEGDDKGVHTLIADLMKAGAKGILFGRNLFQAKDPTAMMAKARRLIYEAPAPSRPKPRARPAARRTQRRRAG